VDGCTGYSGGFCFHSAVIKAIGGSCVAAGGIQRTMSKKMDDGPVEPLLSALRSYPAPWKGELLLVCRKCQKRLKHDGEKSGISKLSKTLKKRARQDENAPRLHVLEVPCLKMCPEGGITVCTQRQLGRGECSIVRSRNDIDALYQLVQGSTLDHVQGEAG
jgi:hypothetical protein